MSEAPQTGDVFWCQNFPGLHGNPPKDRYAAVISPPDKLPDHEGKYLVVPTSATTQSRYAVKMPNQTDQPQATSGLPKPCFAVCDEYKRVKVETLTRRVGDLRTATVTRLQELTFAVIQERLAAKAERG